MKVFLYANMEYRLAVSNGALLAFFYCFGIFFLNKSSKYYLLHVLCVLAFLFNLSGNRNRLRRYHCIIYQDTYAIRLIFVEYFTTSKANLCTLLFANY